MPPRRGASSSRARVSTLPPRQDRSRPRRTTLPPTQRWSRELSSTDTELESAPTLHSEQMPAPKPFAVPKAPTSRDGPTWSRQLIAAVIQLSLVGVGLLLGAWWYAHHHRKSAPQPKSAPIRNAGKKDSTPEEEDFSSRSMREITQAVSFLTGKASGKDQSKGRIDYAKRLSAYKVPTFGVERVREASETRRGTWTYRSLRYHSSRPMDKLRDAYLGHFKKEGYRLRSSSFGRLGSGGYELLGQRGTDRISAKLRRDVEGETVRVVLHERFEGR